MVKALFDTNILIDYLNAVPQSRAELSRYTEKSISLVTWMEVMAGAPAGAEAPTRNFLAAFDIVVIDGAIAERAVDIRRTERIKLPDAIVWATALERGVLFVTRNTKDFPSGDPGVRFPYSI